MYLWNGAGWPRMFWDSPRLAPLLAHVAREQGRLLGRMEALAPDLQREAHLRALTEEAVRSGELEGETLDRNRLRASIARRLGMPVDDPETTDAAVEGTVGVMLEATGDHARPLTQERLFAWHAALFPTGYSGRRAIRTGAWRDDLAGPKQVAAGPAGWETVLYQAPPADRLPAEMTTFLRWLDRPGNADPLLTAGMAHLWFVTLHPFDDGNGRIARAITDRVLARGEGSGRLFYSLSAQLRRERGAYHAALKRARHGSLDITAWQAWFLRCLLDAIEAARDTLGAVVRKARFRERFATEPFNARQIRMLGRLLDGLDDRLTTSGWARLARCSQDTAYRDILDLVGRGALRKNAAGGRSTSYSLREVC